MCDRRLVPGPHLIASVCRTKTQSEQVGLPKVRAPGRTRSAAARSRESAGVSQGTSRSEVTTTSDVSCRRSSSAISGCSQSGVLRMSSTARATGGVTFRLTPASSIVAVTVARPNTPWARWLSSSGSFTRSPASRVIEFSKAPSAA